tara:strand:- start:168 stop:752 length:585 start_codon:yes stop_codon:yes gene_type:complete
MLALIGLGNPSSSHKNNRHNVGFMLIDSVVKYKNLGVYKNKFNAHIINTQISSVPIILVKPQTFMNRSGTCVSQIMHFYKLETKNIVVFHDDIDLQLGKIKTKIGGSNGGHNGLKDIDGHIGIEYRRVRIGIGHPGEKSLVNKYVLGDFNKKDLIITTSFIKNITSQIDSFVISLHKNLLSEVSLILKMSSKIE